MNGYLIREMPVSERPRERLARVGPAGLANHELLAILLQSGYKDESVLDLSKRILYQLTKFNDLNKFSYEELIRIKGVGPAKASVILASFELSKRLQNEETNESYSITSPLDAYLYLEEEMAFLEQEHFVCVYLDTKNKVIAKKTIFIGTLNQSLVHPREVFKYAVKYASASMLVSHNHPSGDSTPSKADFKVQDLLIQGAKMLAINILDHVIIGKNEYYSMTEERKHFFKKQ